MTHPIPTLHWNLRVGDFNLQTNQFLVGDRLLISEKDLQLSHILTHTVITPPQSASGAIKFNHKRNKTLQNKQARG